MYKQWIVVDETRLGYGGNPQKEVEAWIVGGSEGVFAAWASGNLVYFAHGDDGHWWQVGSGFHHIWIAQIAAAILAAKDEAVK